MPPSSVLDITDRSAVTSFVHGVRPEAIAHLAAISFGPEARRDPERATVVNVGGTSAILSAAAAELDRTPVLVASSAEVYGAPAPEDLPLRETAPLRATHPYGLSKIETEKAALAPSVGVPVAVVRSFNHTGPGQRLEFVVPALAARIARAANQRERSVTAGNVDVRRDLSDVRDVVRAYRLVLEALAKGDLPHGRRVYNVASGRAVAIRDVVNALAAIVGIDVEIEIDPDLVRKDDPPEIRGDAARIASDLGWRPTIPLDVTLRDVMDDIRNRPQAGAIAARS
jgi:GDP-4-dehydro-6-deoxy-D-mannose reductase